MVRNYYDDPAVSVSYRFANLELRPVVWEKDVFVNQILVGDALAISTDQAKEHFLTKVFEIKDPNDKAILFGYQTNPEKKRAQNLAREQLRNRGTLSR